jgi:DNA-binding NtrC family response regulator
MSNQSSVLIVDDEEIIRRAHLRSLATCGCEARVAEDGQEAIRLMEQQPSDVILLDIRMPGLDGMEVLKTIKSRWPDSEVVVITGFPNLESAKQAVRLGACDYIAKPVAPEDVVKAANEAMTQKRWTLRREKPNSHQS